MRREQLPKEKTEGDTSLFWEFDSDLSYKPLAEYVVKILLLKSKAVCFLWDCVLPPCFAQLSLGDLVSGWYPVVVGTSSVTLLGSPVVSWAYGKISSLFQVGAK